jgi:hypothetical protein
MQAGIPMVTSSMQYSEIKIKNFLTIPSLWYTRKQNVIIGRILVFTTLEEKIVAQFSRTYEFLKQAKKYRFS